MSFSLLNKSSNSSSSQSVTSPSSLHLGHYCCKATVLEIFPPYSYQLRQNIIRIRMQRFSDGSSSFGWSGGFSVITFAISISTHWTSTRVSLPSNSIYSLSQRVRVAPPSCKPLKTLANQYLRPNDDDNSSGYWCKNFPVEVAGGEYYNPT